jgi:C1A family cysteine protease
MQAESSAGRNHFLKLLQMDTRTKAELLRSVTPVKDQGHRGTCVAFASVALIESQIKQATGRDVDLSEQYIYWESKAVEKINPHADGSEPIDMLRTVEVNDPATAEIERGVPLDAAWPYDTQGWFEDSADHPDCVKAFQKNEDKLPTQCVTNGNPPQQALNAKKITVSHAQKVPSSPESIIGFIDSGIPVEVGLDVYERAWALKIEKNDPNYNTLVAQNLAGVVDMPQPGDTVVGGHAVLIVGYDKDAKIYLFKNSWGTKEWASKSKVPGFGVIPMAYIQKYADAVVAKVNIPGSNSSAAKH